MKPRDVKWSDHFYYDVNSPSCLKWNKDVINGRGEHVMFAKGSNAGHLNSENRWVVATHIDSKSSKFYCHRIIWEIFNCSIPSGMIIDHLNGVSSQNDIDNLRLTTSRGNNKNRGVDSRNSTNVTGVALKKSGNYEYYVAYWVDEFGKHLSKNFSIIKYGREKAFSMAVDLRTSEIARLNTLTDETYSDRHGT